MEPQTVGLKPKTKISYYEISCEACNLSQFYHDKSHTKCIHCMSPLDLRKLRPSISKFGRGYSNQLYRVPKTGCADLVLHTVAIRLDLGLKPKSVRKAFTAGLSRLKQSLTRRSERLRTAETQNRELPRTQRAPRACLKKSFGEVPGWPSGSKGPDLRFSDSK